MPQHRAAPSRLRLALVGGPAYDPLYARLPELASSLNIDIEILAQQPHQDLNHTVAENAAGLRSFDLISTHIKYAPSQRAWLLPLDSYLDPSDLRPFIDATLEQCRVDGALVQLPRLTDARLMHWRRDLFDDAGRAYPETWAELAETASVLSSTTPTAGFAFPGKSSGLFGTFFELLDMAGGRLFDDTLQPAFVSDEGVWALGYLHELYAVRQVAPRNLPSWHFDEISASFREGSVAMIGDWPGYFSLHRDPETAVTAEVLAIDRYPVGPSGRRSVYSGSHSFAITQWCRDIPAAVELLRGLTSYDAQLSEARRGAFPARTDVLAEIRQETREDVLATRRFELLEATVREDMLMFPSLPTYPEIEESVWPLLQQGVTGALPVTEALHQAAERVDHILGAHQP